MGNVCQYFFGSEMGLFSTFSFLLFLTDENVKEHLSCRKYIADLTFKQMTFCKSWWSPGAPWLFCFLCLTSQRASYIISDAYNSLIRSYSAIFFPKRIPHNSNQSWCRSMWAFTSIIFKGTYDLLICLSNFSTCVFCLQSMQQICRSKCHSVQNQSNIRKKIRQWYWLGHNCFIISSF